MSTTEMVIMPKQDYVDLCHTIRHSYNELGQPFEEPIKSAETKVLVLDLHTIGNIARINEDWLISGGSRDEYANDRVRSIRNYGFNNATGPSIAKFPRVTTLGNYAFSNNQAVEQVYFPALRTTGQNAFRGATKLQVADLGVASRVDMNTFYEAASLTTVILRGSTLASLAGLTAFKGTPFAEGGTGGKIYVPSALVESYKTATNWSVLYGYDTCEFVPLEGSEYE